MQEILRLLRQLQDAQGKVRTYREVGHGLSRVVQVDAGSRLRRTSWDAARSVTAVH